MVIWGKQEQCILTKYLIDYLLIIKNNLNKINNFYI